MLSTAVQADGRSGNASKTVCIGCPLLVADACRCHRRSADDQQPKPRRRLQALQPLTADAHALTQALDVRLSHRQPPRRQATAVRREQKSRSSEGLTGNHAAAQRSQLHSRQALHANARCRAHAAGGSCKARGAGSTHTIMTSAVVRVKSAPPAARGMAAGARRGMCGAAASCGGRAGGCAGGPCLVKRAIKRSAAAASAGRRCSRFSISCAEG